MERMKRVVSLMLCIVMVFGLLPMTVFATDVDTDAEIFEEEIAVEAPAVGNENPVDPETIIFEEEIEYVEEAPVIENEEPVAPVITEDSETFEADEEIEVGEDAPDLGNANPVNPIADGDIRDQVTIVEYSNRFEKVNSVTAGNRYIITNTGSTSYNSSSASGYALSAGTDSTSASVTVNRTGSYNNYTYYIENSNENIVWIAGSGLTFQNAATSTYLSANSSNNEVSFVESGAKNWTYSSSRLYYNVTTSNNWGSTTTPYYLRYNNSNWSVSRSSSNVYFYQQNKTSTVYKVSVTNPEITMVNGNTAQIDASLTKGNETISGLTYAVVSGSDVVSVNGSTITAKAAGTAKILVSYTVNGKTIGKFVDVTVLEPGYYVEITEDGKVVTDVITVKGVKANDLLDLGAQVTEAKQDGTITTLTSLPAGAKLEWVIPAEYQNIATVNENGVVTFKGVDGKFYVQVNMSINDEDAASDEVEISATTSLYTVPSDGATDFPQYPNEGAIRYDKTAMAVGNFSSTGIAKMELSMTGVPYTTGSEIDVVIMLDMTGSMNDDAMDAAEASAKAFADQIIKNKDDSFNKNRISVQIFNKNGVTSLWELQAVTSENYNELTTAIESASTKQASGGTPYSTALKGCYEILYAAKSDGIGNDRKQFCVFVSDGAPSSVTYITNATTPTNTTTISFTRGGKTYTQTVPDYTTGTSDTTFESANNNYHEYWSQLMLNNGVGLYGVYTAAAAGGSGSTDVTTGTRVMGKVAGDSSKVYTISDYTDTSALTGVFSNIAQSILQAATDVTVEDKITPEYTMIFGIPTGHKTITGDDIGGQEFYIEFLKYALDKEDHQRTDDVTSMAKLYLGVNNGKYYAASNATGTTAYASPVFEQKTLGDKGTLYYWTTDASKGDTGVSVTVGTTTYYFVSYGLESGWNMTSGAYAAGNVDEHNMSNDLIIATPYFVYNANTKMLYWTVEKLDDAEYVLNYFLYLNDSATEVGYPDEKPAGTYPTNDHAYITYTNFLEHDCRQEFPKPQMTWNGAQASYVFYLVNAKGEPINRSGQKVDFANATFVTDVFTEAVVWNKEANDGEAKLDVDWLAQNKLPEDYMIYDPAARYELHVYEDETGKSIESWFHITSGGNETIAQSLNDRLGLNVDASDVSDQTTLVYNTKADRNKKSEAGYYASKSGIAALNGKDVTVISSGFDFSNTTVAFAVVWQPKLVADTVVVDFGLDVLIDVVENDMLQNKVDGIGLSTADFEKDNVLMYTGIADTSKFGTAPLNLAGNIISRENEKQIRFSQRDMMFNAPVTFYYQSQVGFYENSAHKTGYMYSSVTVIPATTIYYEDSFVTLKSYTWENNGWSEVANAAGEDYYVWSQVGETINNAVQEQDRPGADMFGAGLDADNIYGYDKAYDNCTEYSLGSAMKATVNYDNYGTASFSFYGTGFDVVSLASSNTGMITVDVTGVNVDYSGKFAVDTYYGYAYDDCYVVYEYDERIAEWIRVAVYEKTEESTEKYKDYIATKAPANPKHNDIYVVEQKDYFVKPDADTTMYQVPVMKVKDLPYGQYNVTIEIVYEPGFDHNNPSTANGEYEFYLDAIRIYDPTGNLNTDANNAYEKDGERAPSYQEIRNNLIEAVSFDRSNSDKVNGFMFIDGRDQISIADLTDYANYGPNNEVYLKEGQSIAFMIDAPDKANLQLKNVHFGAKSADGSEVTYSVANIFNDEFENKKTFTLKTSTDMYYDLTEWVGAARVIVITNESESVLSLTNLKYTYGERDSQIFARTTEVVEEVVEAYAYMTAADAEMTLRALNAPAEEETEPTVPETEPEVTEPETTQPGSNSGSSSEAGSVVKTIISLIGKLLGKIFG